jgi:uncharacterized protein YcfL
MKLNRALCSVVVPCFLAVGCLVFSGCKVAAPAATVTERTDSTSVKKDSTWTSVVVVHDTIVTPGETIIIEKRIECDPVTNKPKEFTDKVKGKNSTIDVSLKNGLLQVKAKYDSLLHVIDLKEQHIHTLTEVNTRLSKQKEEVKIVTAYKVHWYDIWARWIAVAVILFSIIKIVIKIYKPL